MFEYVNSPGSWFWLCPRLVCDLVQGFKRHWAFSSLFGNWWRWRLSGLSALISYGLIHLFSPLASIVLDIQQVLNKCREWIMWGGSPSWLTKVIQLEVLCSHLHWCMEVCASTCPVCQWAESRLVPCRPLCLLFQQPVKIFKRIPCGPNKIFLFSLENEFVLQDIWLTSTLDVEYMVSIWKGGYGGSHTMPLYPDSCVHTWILTRYGPKSTTWWTVIISCEAHQNLVETIHRMVSIRCQQNIPVQRHTRR